MSSVGAGMTKAITLPVVGFGLASMKVSKDFDGQMNRVQAIAGATGKEVSALREQAKQLGADTTFSAREAAGGMENLASAGFNTKEIMAAMPGVLDLAAVSGGDVAASAEDAASTMRAFGIETSKAGHVADVFARAAADTNAEAADMGEAMKYVAPIAHSMGISMEETAAAIGIMSDSGIKGSQAGTALRGSLSRLAKPSKLAAEKMDELGVSFYDSQGKILPLKGQVAQLKDAFKGMTDEQKQNALVTIYGQESLSGMMALIAAGPDKIDKQTQSLKNSDGAAKEMADTINKGLPGAIENFMGAIETLQIQLGEILSPVIADVLNHLSKLIEGFLNMPEGAQKAVLAFIGIAAAVGPLLLILGKSLIFFSQMQMAMAYLGGASAVLSTVMGALGGVFSFLVSPIGLLVIAIVGLVAMLVYLYNTNENVKNYLDAIWSAIKTIFMTALSIIVHGVQSSFQIISRTIQLVLNTVYNFIAMWINLLTGNWKGAWKNMKNILGGFGSYFEDILTYICNWGVSVIGDFGQGAIDIFNAFKGVNLGAAGEAIINSLLGGLKSAFEGVKSFIGGIGDWIVAHKGPIQKDRKLLIPAGAAIMASLNQGLTNNFAAVQNTVGGMAQSITDAFSDTGSIDIGSNIARINGQIDNKIHHDVSYGGTKRPMNLTVHIGNQKFKAFVDDISNQMGADAEINLTF